MSCTTDISQRAGPARQFLLGGAVLLALAGSVLAETQIKAEKINRTLIVSDSVQKAGSKISGGWREHAADGSWRSVAFVLDGHVGTVTFGDGEPGRRLPSATRYVYAGPGGKNTKAGEAPAVYSEARVFADATPGIRDRANQSSLIPADVATRVRELGGDIKLMQQATDLKRIAELGSAFDAAGRPAADDRFFGDRPGGAPRRSGGGWKDPRAGVGRDGRAGDDVVIFEKGGTDENGNVSHTTVTRHGDGSTTTMNWYMHADSGSTATTSEDKDASGRVTGGTQDTYGGPGGGSSSARYTRNPDTGVEVTTATRTSPDGSTHGSVTVLYPDGKRRTVESSTPSEVPFSGRGGFDEAWMDKSLPWFMDAVYVEWKRKNDLRKSGSVISQPGRGEDPSPGTSEGPRVGASAVTNCGDTGTNPCARFESAEADARESMNSLTQPPRDVPTGGSVPMPIPGPGPNPQLKP